MRKQPHEQRIPVVLAGDDMQKKRNVRHFMFARGLPAYYFLKPGGPSLHKLDRMWHLTRSMAVPVDYHCDTFTYANKYLSMMTSNRNVFKKLFNISEIQNMIFLCILFIYYHIKSYIIIINKDIG